MEAATATVVTSPLLVSTPPEYCYDHEYLTGYLEDALFQFSASMMKRQRLIDPPTITTSSSSTHEEGQYQQLSPSDCSVFPSSNDNHYHQFNFAGGGRGCSIGSMEIEKNYCSSASSSLTVTDTRARKHHQMEGSATTIDVSGTTTGVNSPPLPGSSENIDDHDFWSMTRTSEQLSGDRHHQHTNNKYCSSIVGGSNSWSTSGYGNEYTFGKAFMKSSETGTAAGGSVMKHEEKKKVGLELMIRRRVAYPFATVRPVGDEDHIITLEEINRKLLMPPRRPVRHPVGKYACKPNVVSAEGSRGLSGKRVVGLTRIYTAGGKGTITIIRTRG